MKKRKVKRFFAILLVFFVFLTLSGFLVLQDAKAKALAGAGTEKVVVTSPEQIRKATQNRLIADFNRYLKSPAEYQERVEQSCDLFPEGDLFPYIYPALGYVNVALKDPNQTANSILQAQKLIDLAIDSVTQRIRPPLGRLENLRSYQDQAVYLGQLNLALGAYYLISDDHRYDREHQVISDVLHNGLVDTQGRALNSFPEASWPFDTIPPLVSLHLYDMKRSGQRSENLIKQHLAWVRANATHSELDLPYSRINNVTGQGLELPRGCDLSLRLCLLRQIDPVYAEQLYDKYAENYWIDRGIVAGFAEWPHGASKFEDVDSGPILMGIGLGATGLGLGATIAIGDEQCFERLCNEMLTSAGIIRTILVTRQTLFASGEDSSQEAFPLDSKYFSGFLFGDAILFYCVTWQPWP